MERIYVRLCAPRVKAFEGEIASSFDRCVTVSEADVHYLRDIAGEADVCTIPSGVDTEYFCPAPDSLSEEPFSLVLTGSFEWKPKQHNLRVLLAEIFPRIQAQIPQAKLYVVGKGVPAEIKEQYGSQSGVTITGMVDDVRPYIQRASLVLNYVESGGGIALKVLEAMAMRKAVLSNSLGCEGIKVEHGRNVFLADGTEVFADAAVSLLRNEQFRMEMANQGFELIKQQYSWNVIADEFTRCYTEVLESRSRICVPSAYSRPDSELATSQNQ
jgi:glycosyltransferase involved in cell wall biosynthesis